MASGLFGRKVAGRSQHIHRIGDGALIFNQLGQPEIGDLGLALFVQEDVSGFEVAMQNAALMGMMDGTGRAGQ